MKLYRIKNLFLGKDLNQEATDRYIVAENDLEVYKQLAKNFGEMEGLTEENGEVYDDWAQAYGGDKEVRERILKNKGDFDEDYLGEFYDIKYGWQDLGEITKEEIQILKKFKIL